MKKIKLLLVSLAVMSLFVACPDPDQPTPPPPPPPTPLSKVTFKPTDKYVKSGSYITLTSKEKGDIYYQLVPAGGEATLTKDNYTTAGTKFNKGVAITENATLYAIAVKDGATSDVVSAEYKIPVPTEDSDAVKLHDMILPAGSGKNGAKTVPAWSKAANALATDLPEVVTGFTTPESNYTKLSGATNRTTALMAAVDKANTDKSLDNLPIKNVIVVFTDGWGESGVVASREHYKIQGQENKGLFMDHLPYHAPVNHDSYVRPYGSGDEEKAVWKYDAANNDWNVKFYNETENPKNVYETTDSTAGGSALNTGYTTYYQGCAVDTHGTEVKSILELAREKGMLVGNVTNDYLTDATPATVGIHSPKRKDSNLINGRMFITSPDWIMGRGGFSGFMGSGDPFGTFAGHEYSASYDGMTKSMLEQWFTANKTKLQAWATAMLKEYDGKTAAANYDFKNWKADRNMQQYSTVKAALEALATDGTIRPYIPLGEDPANHYDYNPDAFNKKTGKYEVAPKIGYKIGYGNKPGYEVAFPNYAEMVASTLYALDKRGKAENRGFFAFIENTSSDGWGHAQRALDVLNETQITDEAIAIAAKYVLENPNTLMIVCADHETGGIKYKSGWETNAAGGNIYSTTSGHSGEPTPFFAFGASANVYFSDIPNFDMSQWTPDEKAAYAMGTIYPAPNTWGENGTGQEAQTTATPAAGPAYPKIIRNRQIGIRLGKALGYTNYGDLNGNGVLDPATEGDSIVDVEGAKIASNKVTLN